jgi:hypothetical protein
MPSQCRSAGGLSPKRCQPTAQETVRRFLCACCRIAVYLCTACDRGQRYCSADCARSARRQSQREADRRYQRSPRGRLKHAERSRCYRLRRSVVTEQGSILSPEHDVSRGSEPNEALVPVLPVETETRPVSKAAPDKLECRLCRRWCAPWVRHAPLRRRVAGPRRESERFRRERSAATANSTRF